MFSRTHRVEITPELVQYLEKKPELDFKIM